MSSQNNPPQPPDWLPDLIDVTGERDDVLNRLYTIFSADFAPRQIFFRRCPVHVNDRMEQGYPERFWHAIEREQENLDWRTFESQRAERLSWCAAVIRHEKDPCIRVWNYVEGGGRQHVYLWLESCNYLVILNYRPQRNGKGVYWLVTAFVVDSEQKRLDLEGKYSRRYPP